MSSNKCYRCVGDRYNVYKRKNGLTMQFGSFKREDTAKECVKQLTAVGWDLDKASSIINDLKTKEHGI